MAIEDVVIREIADLADLSEDEVEDLAAQPRMKMLTMLRQFARKNPKAAKGWVRKNVNAAVDRRSGVLYSTIALTVAAGPVIAANRETFFSQPKGQAPNPLGAGFGAFDERFTNITAAGQIPAGTSFLIEKWGFEVFLALPGAATTSEAGAIDGWNIKSQSALTLKIGQNAEEYFGPVSWYPLPAPSYTSVLSSLAAGAQTAYGMPGPASVTLNNLHPFKPARRIRGRESFQVNLTHGAFTTMATATSVYFAVACFVGQWETRVGSIVAAGR